MCMHVDKDKLSHQARAVSTGFIPAGVGDEARGEEREEMDVQEVVVLCERSQMA